MNFSPIIIIWVFATTCGLIAATLSLILARRLAHLLRDNLADDIIISATKHLYLTEVERAIGWLLFWIVGCIALLTPPPTDTTTQDTSLTVWLLISTIALWSFQTVTDYIYTRNTWVEAKTNIKE